MAKRVRLRSNPARSAPHAAGATVFLMQFLVHARLGTIAHAVPKYWTFHYSSSRQGAVQLKRLHNLVLQIEPDSNEIRSITDEPFLQAVYEAGNRMVSNAVRAVQHLAEDIERHTGAELRGATLPERINEAAAQFSSATWNNDTEYLGLIEISQIRDALEHPKQSTTFSSDDVSWDRVPQRCRRRATLRVERGIESLSPVKKARRKG